VTSPKPEEVALDKLLTAAEPLVKAFFDSKREDKAADVKMQERELTFEERLLDHDTRRHRTTVVVGGVIIAVVLAFAGYLISQGRDAIALDVIQLLVGLGGAVAGGYGIAMSKRRREESSDEE
jgi:hypothetical protein